MFLFTEETVAFCRRLSESTVSIVGVIFSLFHSGPAMLARLSSSFNGSVWSCNHLAVYHQCEPDQMVLYWQGFLQPPEHGRCSHSMHDVWQHGPARVCVPDYGSLRGRRWRHSDKCALSPGSQYLEIWGSTSFLISEHAKYGHKLAIRDVMNIFETLDELFNVCNREDIKNVGKA